jgi:hypothetical protein
MIAQDTSPETPVVFFELDDMPVFCFVDSYIPESDQFAVTLPDPRCKGAATIVSIHRKDLFYSDLDLTTS